MLRTILSLVQFLFISVYCLPAFSQEAPLPAGADAESAESLEILKPEEEAVETDSAQGETEIFEKSAQSFEDKLESTKKAQSEVIEAEELAKNEVLAAQDKLQKRFAEEKLKLETYRVSISHQSGLWFEELKLVMREYESISKRVDRTDEILLSEDDLNQEALLESYKLVKQDWRRLIADGHLMVRLVFDGTSVPSVPKKPTDLLTRVGKEKRASYEKSYQAAKEERKQLDVEQFERIEKKSSDYFRIFSVTSEMRSRLMSKLELSFLAQDSGDAIAADFLREIVAIPFRGLGVVLARYLEVKADFDKGLFGLWSLFQKALALMLLALSPFLARFLGKWLVKQLDIQRSRLLSNRGRTSRLKLMAALTIQKAIPYAPWVLYIVVLFFLSDGLKGTIYDQLRAVIPLVVYYCLYRVFRLLVADSVSALKNFIRTNAEAQSTNTLVLRSTRFVGLFFLVSFSVLHVTRLCVDKAFVYGVVLFAMQVFGLFVCAFAATEWKGILAPASERVSLAKLAFGSKTGALENFASSFVFLCSS